VKSLSSFELRMLLKELQVLKDCHLQKVYQLDNRSFLLSFHGRGERYRLLIELGRFMTLTERDIETPREPSSFVMGLRKHLKNALLVDVEQHGMDRVIVIKFRKEKELDLIIEMFDKGNLILVQDGKILFSLTSKSWSSRDVKRDAEYQFPPGPLDVTTMDAEEFASAAKQVEKDLVRGLILDFNLGGMAAEELCIRLELDKEMEMKEVPDNILKVLHASIIELLGRPMDPCHVKDDGKVIDIAPFPMLKFENMDLEHFGSYSKALDDFFMAEEEMNESKGPGRLERRMKMQKEALAKYQEEEELSKLRAEAVYLNYQQVEGLLVGIQEALESDNLSSHISELEERSIVKGHEPGKGQVSVSLKDQENKAVDVDLVYRLSIHENVERLYDEGKKMAEKVEGVKKAIQESKEEIKSAPRHENGNKGTSRKHFWFEKYRWMISSDDAIIVAGKDAKSNERLVKKHMKDQDFYAHADIHGAPSVVIKGPASDTAKEEACHFAFIFSKAWNSGISSGKAYWVNPDQVSRTPQSGEYLAKGAFVIRGKKNFVDKIPVIAAIGEVEYQGERMIMAGPDFVIRKKANKYVVFAPGNTKRSSFEKQMARAFKCKIEDIGRVLPPGDVEVKETHGLSLD